MVISKILTIEQVAELLNVQLAWLYARTCDGALRGTARFRRGSRRKTTTRQSVVEKFERIPHFKAGRLLRFDRDEVLAWFARMHRYGSEPSGTQPGGCSQAVETHTVGDGR